MSAAVCAPGAGTGSHSRLGWQRVVAWGCNCPRGPRRRAPHGRERCRQREVQQGEVQAVCGADGERTALVG